MSERDRKPAFEGVGLGLRHDLADALFEADPEVTDVVKWVEIHPENYVARGGTFAHNLERALDRWPVVPHGLTCCFGQLDPFEPDYVGKLKALLDRIDAPFYSDHLCFAGAGGRYLHDLLPLPFRADAIDVAAARVRELSDALERKVAIENVSYYADPSPPAMDESTFVLEVLEAADCLLLLDVNNVYVNSINHGFDPRAYIDRMPPERVAQIHVAGHFTRDDGLLIDTHGAPICEGVYSLLEHTIERVGPVPVLLERDQSFPPLEELLEEMAALTRIVERASARRAAARPAASPAREPA